MRSVERKPDQGDAVDKAAEIGRVKSTEDDQDIPVALGDGDSAQVCYEGGQCRQYEDVHAQGE